MSDRLRPDDDPLGSGRRNLEATLAYLFAGQGWTPASLWRHREVSNRSELARFGAFPRVLSRGQRCWDWRQPPDRMDRTGREAAATERRVESSKIRVLYSCKFRVISWIVVSKKR